MAAKYLNDCSLRNKYWVRYGELFTQSDVNLMERQLLLLLDYDLRIDEPELLDYAQPFFASVNWQDLCLPVHALIKTPDVLAEQKRYARSVQRRAKLRSVKKLTGAGARGLMAKNQASSAGRRTSSPFTDDSPSPPSSAAITSSALLRNSSGTHLNRPPSFGTAQPVRYPKTPLSFDSWHRIPLADDQVTVSTVPSKVRLSSTLANFSSGSSENRSTAPTSYPSSSTVPSRSQSRTFERDVDSLADTDTDSSEMGDAEPHNPVLDEPFLKGLPFFHAASGRPCLVGSTVHQYASMKKAGDTSTSPASSGSAALNHLSFFATQYTSTNNCFKTGAAFKNRHSSAVATGRAGKIASSYSVGQSRSMPFLRYLFQGSAFARTEEAPIECPSFPSTFSGAEHLTSSPKSRCRTNTEHRVLSGSCIPVRASSKPSPDSFSTTRSVDAVGHCSPSQLLATRVFNRKGPGLFLCRSDGTIGNNSSCSITKYLAANVSASLQVQPRHLHGTKPVRICSSTPRQTDEELDQGGRTEQNPDQGHNKYSLLTYSAPSEASRGVTPFSLGWLSGEHS